MMDYTTDGEKTSANPEYSGTISDTNIDLMSKNNKYLIIEL